MVAFRRLWMWAERRPLPKLDRHRQPLIRTASWCQLSEPWKVAYEEDDGEGSLVVSMSELGYLQNTARVMRVLVYNLAVRGSQRLAILYLE